MYRTEKICDKCRAPIPPSHSLPFCRSCIQAYEDDGIIILREPDLSSLKLMLIPTVHQLYRQRKHANQLAVPLNCGCFRDARDAVSATLQVLMEAGAKLVTIRPPSEDQLVTESA